MNPVGLGAHSNLLPPAKGAQEMRVRPINEGAGSKLIGFNLWASLCARVAPARPFIQSAGCQLASGGARAPILSHFTLDCSPAPKLAGYFIMSPWRRP